MKKYLLFLVPFFLSGCPAGHNTSLYPAQSKVVDSKVCVFVDQKDMIKSENILQVSIWDYSSQKNIYEKSYAMSPISLQAGECVPGIGDFDFVSGTSYAISIDTPLYTYLSRFSVSEQHGSIILSRM